MRKALHHNIEEKLLYDGTKVEKNVRMTYGQKA